MPFKLPELPYALDALEPHMSAKTLGFHHGKHHQGYIDALNKVIAGTPFEAQTLEQIMLATHEDSAQKIIYNNAAQSWNHAFFWKSLTPAGGGVPPERLAKALKTDFGSVVEFKMKFKAAALSQFGSGWVWLVSDLNQLQIIATSNADNPLIKKQHPLICCDVWEHAYYLDYQNRRAEMLDAFLEHLVDWSFAEQNLMPHLAEHPTYLS